MVGYLELNGSFLELGVSGPVHFAHSREGGSGTPTAKSAGGRDSTEQTDTAVACAKYIYRYRGQREGTPLAQDSERRLGWSKEGTEEDSGARTALQCMRSAPSQFERE